jgi:hypothetical protein
MIYNASPHATKPHTERESALARGREQRLADERDYKRRRKTYRTKSGQKKATEVGHIMNGPLDDEGSAY